MEVAQDQIDVATESHGTISGHARNRRVIVGLVPQAVSVRMRNWRIFDLRAIELAQACSGDLAYACGNVFPPCLVCGNAQLLCRFRLAVVLDEALPALP